MTDQIPGAIFFDCEATGTNPYEARIWELAFRKIEDDEPTVWRFNPPEPVPEEVQELCGVTNEELEEEPPFSYRARAVQRQFSDRLLVGYNIRKYDTPLLNKELERAGLDGFNLARVPELDLFQVWKAMEPRTLEGCVKRFLGRATEFDAHQAEEDIRHLEEVGQMMALEFGLDLADMLDVTQDGVVDRSGKLTLNDAGVVCFNFGKHKGEPVANHPDYISGYMMQADFPDDTLQVLKYLRKNNWVWGTEARPS